MIQNTEIRRNPNIQFKGVRKELGSPDSHLKNIVAQINPWLEENFKTTDILLRDYYDCRTSPETQRLIYDITEKNCSLSNPGSIEVQGKSAEELKKHLKQAKEEFKESCKPENLKK